MPAIVASRQSKLWPPSENLTNTALYSHNVKLRSAVTPVLWKIEPWSLRAASGFWIWPIEWCAMWPPYLFHVTGSDHTYPSTCIRMWSALDQKGLLFRLILFNSLAAATGMFSCLNCSAFCSTHSTVDIWYNRRDYLRVTYFVLCEMVIVLSPSVRVAVCLSVRAQTKTRDT